MAIKQRFANSRRRSGKRRAVVLFALLGSVLVIAAALFIVVDNRSSEKSHERALEYRQQGEVSASIIELKNALQKDPENIAARILLGQIYLDIRDLVSAEKELQRARTYGADASVIVAPLSRTWLLRRDYQKVLDQISPEGLDAAGRANVLVARGRAYAGLDQLDKAREAIGLALLADAQNIDAWIETARIAINANDFAAAEQALARLAELAPDNLETIALRGDLYLRSGKYGEAVAQYEAVIARLPGHLQTKVALANAFMAQGIEEEANRILNTALGQAPTSADANYLNAVIAFRNEDYRMALSSAEQALRANPDHLPSLLIAASAEFAFGRLELAERNLRRVLALDPNHEFATQLLAAVRERRTVRDRKRTLAVLIDDTSTPAVVASAVDPVTSDRQTLRIGLAYLDGRRGSATANEAASGVDEKIDDARRLLTSGKAEEAFRLIEAELIARMTNREILTVAAAASLLMNRADRARLVLRSLEDLEPEATEVQYLLAVAYRRLGDGKSHVERLRRSLVIKPDFLPAVAEQGRLALQETSLEQTETAVRKLQEPWRDRPAYLDLAAGLALLRERTADATDLYRQALEQEPTTLRVLRLAYVEHRSGRTAESGAILKDWLDEHPGDTTVVLVLANKRLASGEFVEAAELYSAILRRVPDHIVAINNLAWLSLQLDDNANALRLVRQGMELAPDDPRMMDTLAEIFMSDGNYTEALPLLKRAALSDDSNPGLQVRLARALAGTGSPEDARELLRKTLKANPQFPERQEAERLSKQLQQ